MFEKCDIPGCGNNAIWKCCGQDGAYDIFYACDDHVDMYTTDWIEKINEDGEFMHEEIGY